MKIVLLVLSFFSMVFCDRDCIRNEANKTYWGCGDNLVMTFVSNSVFCKDDLGRIVFSNVQRNKCNDQQIAKFCDVFHMGQDINGTHGSLNSQISYICQENSKKKRKFR